MQSPESWHFGHPPSKPVISSEFLREKMKKMQIKAPEVLCEAYDYPKPSSFSRGMRVDIKGITFLFISGTASVNHQGKTVHKSDFKAQTKRTFENLTALLKSENADWKNVARTTCYLRDMKDYAEFNEIRTAFYAEIGLDPLPASTCVEARLCREDLLVEIESIAIIE